MKMRIRKTKSEFRSACSLCPKGVFAIIAAVFISTACSDSDDPDTVVAPQAFTLTEFPTAMTVVEGEQAVEVTVSVSRSAGFDDEIALQIAPSFLSNNPQISASVEPSSLAADVDNAQITLSYPIAVAPTQPATLELPVLASAGSIQAETTLTLNLSPTPAPDVYLLIGQSNMVGDSEPGSLQNQPGQPDAPDPRIRQLNVTNNDRDIFDTQASFSDPDNIAGIPSIITAADPLHTVLPVGANSKIGDQIGLGLSFAKAALPNTTSTVLLVPAAWGGTGFCNDPARLTGWNPEPRSNTRMRGTGLYLRAVARTNLALQESGGILRGILWHQGESDTFNAECANDYAQNLQILVRSLREDIIEDGRGSDARGSDANIPFVLGTLSRGSDSRGDFSVPTPEEQTIDNALRSVQSLISHADFADFIDLVPPAFPCGDDSCIHFGAAAYREMGSRYNDTLRGILSR